MLENTVSLSDREKETNKKKATKHNSIQPLLLRTKTAPSGMKKSNSFLTLKELIEPGYRILD